MAGDSWRAGPPPGFPGPVRHRHAQMTDVFYVLEGELTFDLGGEQRSLGAGSFVLVPETRLHRVG